MKRGRPNIRQRVQTATIKTLEAARTPLTVSNIKRLVSKEIQQQVSWNTIYKYLRELVEANKAQPVQLPHSKNENKRGLTVYILKK